MERKNYNGSGGRGRGARGGAGRGYGRGGNYQQQGQHQSGGDRMIRPTQRHDGAYRSPVTGNGGRGNHTQMLNNPPPAQQWAYRPQVQRQGGANGLPIMGPGSSGGATGVGRRGGTWSGVVARDRAPPPRPQVAVTAQIELSVMQPVNYSDMISEVPELNGINYSDMTSDVPELNGDNYKVWKERVLLLLLVCSLLVCWSRLEMQFVRESNPFHFWFTVEVPHFSFTMEVPNFSFTVAVPHFLFTVEVPQPKSYLLPFTHQIRSLFRM